MTKQRWNRLQLISVICMIVFVLLFVVILTISPDEIEQGFSLIKFGLFELSVIGGISSGMLIFWIESHKRKLG